MVVSRKLPGAAPHGISTITTSIALVFASVVAAWMVASGRAMMAAGAVIVAPLAVILAAKPWRSVAVAVLLTLLVPFTYTLGVPQASIPRVASMFALLAIALGASSQARIRLTAVDFAVLGLFVGGILSWQVAPHPPHSLRAALNFLIPLALYPAGRYFASEASEGLLWALFGGGALASLTVYFEFFVTRRPLWVDASSYYWNEGGNYIFRPGGLFGSPPGAGTVLAVTTLCGLPLIARSRGGRRLLVAVAAALSAGALMLTFTRGSIIGFAFGVLVFVSLQRPQVWGRFAFGATAVALLVVLVVLPKVSGERWYEEGVLRAGTLAQRQSYWAISWPLITNSTQHFVIGHGINALVIGRPELPGPVDPDISTAPDLTLRGPHNQYVRVLLEGGVAGLALMLLWLFGTLGRGARAAWRATTDRTMIAAGTAAVASVIVAGLVGDTFRFPPTLAVTALISGLIVSWSQRSAHLEQTES